jgi:O-antigen ligase
MISKIFKDLKKITFYESLLLLFPIFSLLGSFFVNLLMISTIFFLIYEFFKSKYPHIWKETWIYFYFLFIFYNIFRSFFATDTIIALNSSFSLIRYLSFSLFIFLCIPNTKNLKIIIKYWIIILMLVCVDTLIQYFFGADVFGFPKGMDGLRLSGPFGRRLVVGAYLAYISIPLIFYFFSKFKNFHLNEKIFFFIIYFFLFLTIALTGERLAFLIFLFSSVLIFFFYLPIKKFFYLFIFFIFFLLNIYYISPSFNIRVNQFYSTIKNIENSPWGRLYNSSYLVFKTNYFFGVGLKNYSIVCDTKIIDTLKNFSAQSPKYEFCSTHPHNFYLEILSETGLIGLIILSFTFGTFLFSIFKKIKILKNNKIYRDYNGLLYGNILILLIYIWPIKTSGRFFTTWNGSFFWFNLGIALLITKDFYKKINK